MVKSWEMFRENIDSVPLKSYFMSNFNLDDDPTDLLGIMIPRKV